MDFAIKILCHIYRSMSVYCLIFCNMSPDGVYDWDEESKEEKHYGGQ